jgi:hypothetical protein
MDGFRSKPPKMKMVPFNLASVASPMQVRLLHCTAGARMLTAEVPACLFIVLLFGLLVFVGSVHSHAC